MPVRVNVRPELLEWAVHRSRIDADALADRLPMFELWLSGASSPTLKQLESFARRTHTPLGYLFLEGPPVEALSRARPRACALLLPTFVSMKRPVSDGKAGGLSQS